MELIFNAEALRPPITGVGNYSFHLLRQFLAGDEVDAIHCFTGTHWQDGQAQRQATASLIGQGGTGSPGAAGRLLQGVRKAVGLVPGTKAAYDALMERRFSSYANGLPGAIYHETNYILKPYDGPCVTTVHDLSHMRFPQFHPRHVVERLNRLLPVTLARADRVITVSDVVRDELLTHFDLPAEKVCTVYEGVDKDYVPRDAVATAPVLDAYGLQHKAYVLLVATLEPRKGIDVLLAAWEQLPAELRREYPLVLTGSSGWLNKDLLGRLEALKRDGSVRHLGYVASSHLPALFSGAAVFCYPSVYEGFGLPVLDAMSSGVPVICRAGTSMAEFSRGACLLCDSGEPAELALKLRQLLEDEAERERWGHLGRERSTDFSWERCARETLQVYRQCT